MAYLSNKRKFFIVRSGGGSQAETSEIVPTADVSVGSWTAAPLFSKIDEPRASVDAGNYIEYFDITANTSCVISFVLPGGDISTINVYSYNEASGICDLNVEISQDNSTWTSIQTMSFLSAFSRTEKLATFSSLGWSNPSTCYVRLKGSDNSFNSFYLYSVSIVINP